MSLFIDANKRLEVDTEKSIEPKVFHLNKKYRAVRDSRNTLYLVFLETMFRYFD